MSNPTELLNCPFCGGREASVCEREHLHFVMCDNCTAEGPAIDGAQSKLDAAKEWNRRAQPEGEAPQAKDTPESMAQSNARFAIDGAVQYGRENRNEPPGTDHWLYEYWNIGRQLAQLGATGWDNVTPAPPATLSPLCGAQHAESGKEGAAIAAFKKWHQEVGDQDCEYTWLQAWTAAQCAKPASSPGAPEASKKPAHGHRDDYYLLANGRRLGLEPISRVRNMPNWVLAMELFATGSTSARQLCRDAGVHPDSTITHRAAQLDGGQEGSESNG